MAPVVAPSMHAATPTPSSERGAACRGTHACATVQPRRRGAPRPASAQRRAGSSSAAAWQTGGTSSSRCRPRRTLRPAASAPEAAEAPQQGGALVPDRQGYRSYELEGAEFLIAETPEGWLDLRDAFVTTDVGDAAPADGASPSWRRVDGCEGIPQQPWDYQEVPWYSEYDGDAISGQPGKQWVWRMYLVPLTSCDPEAPLELDFGATIWVLDGKTASLSAAEVHRLAPPDTPPHELTLRIRDEVVTLDTAESVPHWEHAARARHAGVPALSALERARLREYLAALEAARQQGTLSEAEFEEAYDAHWLAALQAGSEGVQALAGNWAGGGEAPVADDAFAPVDPQEDVMGGWDQALFEDLMPQYDDESDEGDFEEFDSPAADY